MSQYPFRFPSEATSNAIVLYTKESVIVGSPLDLQNFFQEAAKTQMLQGVQRSWSGYKFDSIRLHDGSWIAVFEGMHGEERLIGRPVTPEEKTAIEKHITEACELGGVIDRMQERMFAVQQLKHEFEHELEKRMPESFRPYAKKLGWTKNGWLGLPFTIENMLTTRRQKKSFKCRLNERSDAAITAVAELSVAWQGIVAVDFDIEGKSIRIKLKFATP